MPRSAGTRRVRRSSGDALGQAHRLKGRGEPGSPFPGDAQQAGQVGWGDPGPVEERVEAALRRGREHRWRELGITLPERAGKEHPSRQGLNGGEAAPLDHGKRLLKGEDAGEGGQPPDAVAGTGVDDVRFEGEEGRQGSAPQEPARVPQPHLVRQEQEERAGEGTLGEPPQALGEGRAIGDGPVADDAQDGSVREEQGRVQRRGPVPADAEGPGRAAEGDGQAVDDGNRVEPLQEQAAPVGRDGPRAQEPLDRDALRVGQAPHARGGEAVAARGRDEPGCMRKRGDEAPVLKLRGRAVHRGRRAAREGGEVEPVGEGRLRQLAQERFLAGQRFHGSPSSPGAVASGPFRPRRPLPFAGGRMVAPGETSSASAAASSRSPSR